MLAGGVAAAVHHAEVIALRLGEPLGTLVLALAITIIETALIISIMAASQGTASTLARDSIFAALMIICTGVLGVCLFFGGLRHREQHFRVEGASSALAALVTLAVLSLVMPSFTTSTAGPTFAPAQLLVISVLSLVLWGSFVAVQTGRHRDYFLPQGKADNERVHAEPPSVLSAWISLAQLVVALVAVVGLAKHLSRPMDILISQAGAPKAVLGILIALVVLLPETVAALRAARANRFQTSANLALGSALASIGLTIPVVALASLAMNQPLVLGLEPKSIVLLALAFGVNGITLGLGRSNVLLGVVHLVLFATFLLLAFVP